MFTGYLIGMVSNNHTTWRSHTDTFQLLIGAIAIQDSEIQKQLARESRTQARRSTALTALAAIYLPLSLTTGVFGMNISDIDQGRRKYWDVLALGLGLLLATLPFLLWIFFDKDDEDKKREKSPASGQRRDDLGSGPSAAANGDIREPDDLRTKQRDVGILRHRTTMSSRMSRVATGEIAPKHSRAVWRHSLNHCATEQDKKP